MSEHKSNYDDDTLVLRNSTMWPAISVLAPFVPLILVPHYPFMYLLLLFPIADFFFSTTGRLCRKYIASFERCYVGIFLACGTIRLLFVFVDLKYALVVIIIFPAALVVWGKFVFREWDKLYQASQ